MCAGCGRKEQVGKSAGKGSRGVTATESSRRLMKSFRVMRGAVGAYLLGVWGLPFVLAETASLPLPSRASIPSGAGTSTARSLNGVGRLDQVSHWRAQAIAAVREMSGAD